MTDHDEVLDRIRGGLLYTESEASFQNPRRRADLIFDYNQTRPGDDRTRRDLLERILGSVGARTVLLSPFHADDDLTTRVQPAGRGAGPRSA